MDVIGVLVLALVLAWARVRVLVAIRRRVVGVVGVVEGGLL
jgi:hypothetical protein